MAYIGTCGRTELTSSPKLSDEFSGVIPARRKPSVFAVEFATTAGTLQTLEGAVAYEVGSAIVTGIQGECWPVPRTYFETAYEPTDNGQFGQNGLFRRRPEPVLATKLQKDIRILLSEHRGTLSGHAGDWLIERNSGDRSIVAAEIFALTYDPVDTN